MRNSLKPIVAAANDSNSNAISTTIIAESKVIPLLFVHADSEKPKSSEQPKSAEQPKNLLMNTNKA